MCILLAPGACQDGSRLLCFFLPLHRLNSRSLHRPVYLHSPSLRQNPVESLVQEGGSLLVTKTCRQISDELSDANRGLRIKSNSKRGFGGVPNGVKRTNIVTKNNFSYSILKTTKRFTIHKKTNPHGQRHEPLLLISNMQLKGARHLRCVTEKKRRKKKKKKKGRKTKHPTSFVNKHDSSCPFSSKEKEPQKLRFWKMANYQQL